MVCGESAQKKSSSKFSSSNPEAALTLLFHLCLCHQENVSLLLFSLEDQSTTTATAAESGEEETTLSSSCFPCLSISSSCCSRQRNNTSLHCVYPSASSVDLLSLDACEVSLRRRLPYTEADVTVSAMFVSLSTCCFSLSLLFSL